MIGTEVTCARPECNINFTKTTHNQKYCSPDCCRIATNAEIMRRYHRDKAILNGAKRFCEHCKVTRLSRYNTADVCSSCEKKLRKAISDDVTELFSSVSWL